MKQHNVLKYRFPNPPVKPKKKHPSFKVNFAEYFYDYSSNTSIQGIKYLGDRTRSISEKLFWVICLSISIYWCAYLINRVYYKWQNSPVIVTFTSHLIPVWSVPFPAITICPEGKTKKSVYDYTDAFNKFYKERDSMSEHELKHFEQMNFLCGDLFISNGSKILQNDTIDFMFKVAPTSDEWKCKWNHTEEDRQSCSTLLTPILTDEGVCFTFNMLDREELFTSSVYYHRKFFNHGIKSPNWSLERGYLKDAGIDAFPRRSSAGFPLNFDTTLLSYEPNLDYGCRGAVRGYKVLLHNPSELPKMHQNGFMTSFDKQIVVSVKPNLMITSDALKKYDLQQRQCYYPYEKHLKYFQVYTQHNCELECVTNHTLKSCGCVFFYMPRNATTHICGRGNVLCMKTAERILIIKESILENGDNKNEIQDKCNCLPSCTSLTYDTEISDVDHKWKEEFHARNQYENISNYTLTQINFFYKVQYFTATKRKERYGHTDFIANCGGFFSLFIGFSFLSIVEIIYYLTLRLICNVKTHGLHFWSGSTKILFNSNIPKVSKTCNKGSHPQLNKDVLPTHRLTVINVNW